MRLSGLAANEQYVLAMEDSLPSHLEHVSKGKIGKQPGSQPDMRNVRLQKALELDYLDHQYAENQGMFSHRYSSPNDHFSRFIQNQEY